MLSGVRSATTFSKCCGKKEKNTASGRKFSSLWKNWILCSSINWPSHLVNSASCKCSALPHKVTETFLVLAEKEQCLGIETQVYVNSLFLVSFFSVLLCFPITNILTDLNIQHLSWRYSNSYLHLTFELTIF